MTGREVCTVERGELDVTRREFSKAVTAAAVGTAAVAMTAGSAQAQSTQISGTVTDSDGTVGGATVVAVPHDNSLDPLATTTASDGTYQFAQSDLHNGTNLYHVIARDGTQSSPRRGQENYPFVEAAGPPTLPNVGIEHQWNPRTVEKADGSTIDTLDADVGHTDLFGGGPVYDATAIDGTPGIDYDGTDDQLDAETTDMFSPGTGPRTYFCVVKDPHPQSNTRLFCHTQQDGQPSTPINQYRWNDPGSGIVLECRLNGSNNNTVLVAPGVDDGNPHLVTLTHDGSSTTRLYVDNGTEVDSDTSTTVGGQSSMDYFVQGAFTDSTGFVDTVVGHCGMSSQFWSQSDVQEYYAYLPWTSP